VWNLRNKINEQRKKRDKPKNRLVTIENNWWLPEGWGGTGETGERD